MKTIRKKKFNGKIYVELYDRCTKAQAAGHVRDCKATGDFARSVKEGKWYTVYYRSYRWQYLKK